MRKLFLLLTFCAGFVSLQAQTFTSGLTTTGTNTRLGGTNPLLVNTTIDLGTFNFGLKTTAQPNLFNVLNNGNIGLGILTPLSFLHIKAGTATAAPLIFSTGINLTTPVAGAFEYNGTNLFFTPTTAGRKTIAYSDLSNLTAILPVANGGTGASTNTGVLFGNGLAATTSLAATAGNQYLRRNAGNTAYEFASITGGTGTVTSIGLTVPSGLTVTPATPITTSGTFAIATTLNGLLRGNGTGFITGQANLGTEVSGILPISNGGTGTTTSAAALTALLPTQSAGTSGQVLKSNGLAAPTWTTVAGTGTVTNASIVPANGISGTVATSSTTPAITLSLGAITPTSTNGVTAATMAFVDPTSSIQSQLNGKQPTFGAQVAKTFFSAPNVAAGVPSFRAIVASDIPILNQNTTGTAFSITGNLPQSQVTNLVTDLAGKQGSLIISNTGTSGPATIAGNVLNIPNYGSGITNFAWGLNGNSGTNHSDNFIGTTDNVPFIVKTNNVQYLKIDPILNSVLTGLNAGSGATNASNSIFTGNGAGRKNFTTNSTVGTNSVLNV